MTGVHLCSGCKGWKSSLILAALLVSSFADGVPSWLHLHLPRLPNMADADSSKVGSAGRSAVNKAPLRCRDLPLKAGLLQQREEELKTHGERLTVMCVGESGVGKSSLISNIFTVPVDSSKVMPTKTISEQVLRSILVFPSTDFSRTNCFQIVVKELLLALPASAQHPKDT